jgi:CRP-like cAMP-binding protein
MKNSLPLYNTYRQRLSGTDLFQGLPVKLIDDMLAHFRLETWNKGSVHDCRIALKRFYVIVDGRMELLQTHPLTGKQVAILILRPGDVYDVLSLLDSREHKVIPGALDDLQLFSAPIDEVRRWIFDHPEFNRNFMPYLARQIRNREMLATDLALYDTDTRLARLILRYATLDGEPDDSMGNGIEAKLLHGLSNEKLAQMIGSARQVVNRHLQAMKREGVLHSEKHRLIIDDLRKLRERAEALQADFLY